MVITQQNQPIDFPLDNIVFSYDDLTITGTNPPTSEQYLGGAAQFMAFGKMGLFYAAFNFIPSNDYDFTGIKISVPLENLRNYPRYPGVIPSDGAKLGITVVGQAQVNPNAQFEYFDYTLSVEDTNFVIQLNFANQKYSGIQLTHVYPNFNYDE